MNIIATVKGSLNTSIKILLDTVLQVGDTLDLSNITQLVPGDINTTRFFQEYVNFCAMNKDSRYYRIDAIAHTQKGWEMQVSPL